MALGMEVGLGPVHSSPPQKWGQSPPIFGPSLLWPNGIQMPLATEVSISPGDFVLDGDPAPTPTGAETTQFLAHVYCGQMAG